MKRGLSKWLATRYKSEFNDLFDTKAYLHHIGRNRYAVVIPTPWGSESYMEDRYAVLQCLGRIWQRKETNKELGEIFQ